ncbi:hypothetical protein BD779DRAFT_1681847 [Infundibulicybe gibba]|nr:hypothetical protein BD779DRAFT_1681847 [Infundibulicybe gibba]
MGQTQSVSMRVLDDHKDTDGVEAFETHIRDLLRIEKEQTKDSDVVFDRFRQWTIACQRAGQEFQREYQINLLKAFRKLSGVTQAALEAPDGHLNHPGNAHILASILETKASFEHLLDISKSALNNISDETQEAFADEATVYKKIKRLEEYEIELRASHEASGIAARATNNNLREAISSFVDAQNQLRREIDKLDDFFMNLFGDKESALAPSRDRVNREAAQVRHYEICVKLYDHLGRIEDRIFDRLHDHIHRLKQLLNDMQQQEHSIIDAKGASFKLFSETYDMEIRFQSRTILIDKEEFLQHIRQVLNVDIAQNSGEFLAIKAAIRQRISDNDSNEENRRLGRESAWSVNIMDI